MLIIEFTKQFKKNFKRYQHKQEIIDALHEVLNTLAHKRKLPEKNCDHNLTGDYLGSRECHVKNDVLIIYHVSDGTRLIIERIGSHSELF